MAIASQQQIADAAAYAGRTARWYRVWIAQRGIPTDGRSFLEIGPGTDFGAPILLADTGLSVAAADRFLSVWNDDYHPAFYRALRQWCGPSPSLDRVIDQNGYTGVVEPIALAAEELRQLLPRQFDLIFSTAALEHVYDFDRAMEALSAVTAPDGLQSHQIDLRDHHDFARPLEHLLEADHWTADLARDYGHPRRASEIEAVFTRIGLKIEETIPTAITDEPYMTDLLPRLRCAASRYRDWPNEDLYVLGARWWLRKNG